VQSYAGVWMQIFLFIYILIYSFQIVVGNVLETLKFKGTDLFIAPFNAILMDIK
jgi:hypothetical protein